jgi:hypothetical protein
MSQTQILSREIDRWSERLLVDGYCLIPNLLPAETVAALDADLAVDFEATPFCEGRFYGEQTKRFGRLLARSPLAADLVQQALIIGIVERVLQPWCDTIQLNLTQAIAVHPGALPQMPHRDQDMWRGEVGEIEYLVNVTCLEHAPPPLTASGLDMRGGHPAVQDSIRLTSEVLTPRRRNTAPTQVRVGSVKCKREIRAVAISCERDGATR